MIVDSAAWTVTYSSHWIKIRNKPGRKAQMQDFPFKLKQDSGALHFPSPFIRNQGQVIPQDPGGDLGLCVPGIGTNTFLRTSKPQSRGGCSRPALCSAFPGPQHCAAHCFAPSLPGFALLRCFPVPISWIRNKVLELWSWILAQVPEKKAQQCLSFFLYLVLNLLIKNYYYYIQYAYGAICIWCICKYATCIWWLT